jgi:integrase/recombinase XerD
MPRTIPTITDEEFEILLKNVNTTRDSLLLLFMFDAGLRVSEVCQLQVRDVACYVYEAGPPSNEYMSLFSCVTIRAECSKNGHSREVPMTIRLKEALLPYTSLRYFRPLPSIDKPLFPGFNARKTLSPRAVQKLIQWLSEYSIRRRIHPHVLRHSFATRLMRKAPISVVQQLLGHKNISSTQVYMHPVLTDAIKAIAEIQKP